MPTIAQFDTLGGTEKIELVDVPVQPPAADEVQVRTRAAGLNRAELLHVASHYLVDSMNSSESALMNRRIVSFAMPIRSRMSL